MAKQVFRPEYEAALRVVGTRGELVIQFASEAKAYGERLMFYKYLKSVKEDKGNELWEVAQGAKVAWVKDPRMEFSGLGKCVLVITGSAKGASEWGAAIDGTSDVSAVREAREKEEALQNARKEIEGMIARGEWDRKV